MVFGVKSAPAVGAKGVVINMIINRWLIFQKKNYMTWLEISFIILGVHIRNNHHV